MELNIFHLQNLKGKSTNYMSEKDIRWKQRLTNFIKAYSKLQEAVEPIRNNKNKGYWVRLSEESFVDDLVKDGVIQRFEYAHELAWNVMKDFLEASGNVGLYGSRDATREALSKGLLENGDIWMDMIKSRNKTSHTYNEETAEQIYDKIIDEYFDVFTAFLNKMTEIKQSFINE